MDEFAFRRGCTYGTVLVDVAVGRVVDVLPDRTSETFAAWLKDHPGAEIICRDRATAFTKAVKDAPRRPRSRRPGCGRVPQRGEGLGGLVQVDVALSARAPAAEEC